MRTLCRHENIPRGFLGLCILTVSFLGDFFLTGCSSTDGDDVTKSPSGDGGNDGAWGAGGNEANGVGGTTGEPGGTGGTSSSGGSGNPPTASPGCGEALGDDAGRWVEQTPLLVDGLERTWWVWWPEGYDEEEPYPAVFLFHGCGDEANNLPLEDYAGGDAILVRGLADGSDGCWDTVSNTNGKFFEAMLEAVSQRGCVRSSRVFAVGYDSGAELISRLSCYQAYLIDAIATVAGNNALFENPTCNGPVAAMVIHDETDTEWDISGSEGLRDRLTNQNFCVSDGFSEPTEPEPCVQYSGCGAPVVWCETTGEGHERQDDFAAPAIWDFFSAR